MSPNARKPPAFLTIAVLLCAAMLPLTACTQPMNAKPKPEYRENPSPQQAYQVTMAINDAPGEFGWIQGFVQYDVVNRECLPPPKENPGGTQSPLPTRSIPFALQRTADGGYTGTVFTDAMVDEDYHGRGVCRWALKNVQVQLKATGAKPETLFMADLYGEELLAHETKALHYWKARYPQEVGFDDYPESGRTSLDKIAENDRSEFFEITLTARRAP